MGGHASAQNCHDRDGYFDRARDRGSYRDGGAADVWPAGFPERRSRPCWISRRNRHRWIASVRDGWPCNCGAAWIRWLSSGSGTVVGRISLAR